MLKSYPDKPTIWQKIGAWMDALAEIEMNDESRIEARIVALEGKVRLIEDSYRR